MAQVAVPAFTVEVEVVHAVTPAVPLTDQVTVPVGAADPEGGGKATDCPAIAEPEPLESVTTSVGETGVGAVCVNVKSPAAISDVNMLSNSLSVIQPLASRRKRSFCTPLRKASS